MEWNSDAKQALHAHIKQSTNDDPTSEVYQDLFTDLTAHVEEELHQKGNTVIDLNSLQTILSSFGENEFEDDTEQAPNNTPTLTTKSQDPAFNTTANTKANSTTTSNLHPIEIKPFLSKSFSSCTWLFGILIPTIALILELATDTFQSIFFNNTPTWFHVILIALVPVTFFKFLIFGQKIEESKNGSTLNLKELRTLKVLLGFILPVLIYYSLLTIPIIPIGFIACIFLVGFLILSPLLCLIGWIRISSKLRQIQIGYDHPHAKKWLRYGALAGFLFLLILETPSYLAQKAITDATSDDPETSQRGIENIRLFGGEDELLYLSYHGERSRMGGSLNGSKGDTPAHWVYKQFNDRVIPSKKARTLYYQVTGIAFNSINPQEYSGHIRGLNVNDLSWDEDHGGDEVAARTKGLSLHSSRMDMHVDDVSRLGYVEWIIEFKNMNRDAKEARMQVALPHDAFVSKLTLWVNGEERPASFNTVSKVKSAYKKIAVVQRRDPVLVNVSGADRIMLQCFPVPADGGIMKMKVGFTFPLTHSDTLSDSGNVHFPYIAERNFSIPKNLKHQIYAQGNLQINAPHATKDSSGNITSLQYSLNNPALKTERITWKDLSPNNSNTIWTIDPYRTDSDIYLTRQISQLVTTDNSTPREVLIVVDSSTSMAKWKPMISKILEENNPAYQLYIAGSQFKPLTLCESAEQFEDTTFIGGIDNVYALRKAISIAKQNKNKPTSILWLHGSQPLESPEISGLEQDLERMMTDIPIYHVSLDDGANHILAAFKGSTHFHGGCRVVNETDLIHMVETIHQPKTKTKYEWKRSDSQPTNGTKTWDHLARLWAHKKTLANLNNPSFSKLAASYQLVTPLSGAVVLETEKQYIETGLEIPTGKNSPTIPVTPEPSSTLLIILGLLVTSMRRQR